VAGPASLLSWVVAAIIALLFSFYFAELVSMYPKSGGVYEYVKNAFGSRASFVTGWTAWIIANITIAMLIVGSIMYILPDAAPLLKIGLSIGIILVFNFINYRGMNWAGKLLVFFGVMTIISILGIAIPGLFQVFSGRARSLTAPGTGRSCTSGRR